MVNTPLFNTYFLKDMYYDVNVGCLSRRCSNAVPQRNTRYAAARMPQPQNGAKDGDFAAPALERAWTTTACLRRNLMQGFAVMLTHDPKLYVKKASPGIVNLYVL